MDIFTDNHLKVILCASEHICSIVRYCFRSFKHSFIFFNIKYEYNITLTQLMKKAPTQSRQLFIGTRFSCGSKTYFKATLRTNEHWFLFKYM